MIFFNKTNICLKGLLPALLLFGTLGLTPSTWAGGLRCSVGEVVIENLKIGQSYSLKTLANLPLAVTNTGEQTVTVRVEPLVPSEGELRQGAEPIPAGSWAKAVPDSFQLAPQETKAVEMVLNIPNEEGFFGKKFQVTFWSHSLAQPGDLLAVGLNSRVIFTIDRERETPGVVPSGDLGISILPSEITLENIRSGRLIRLDEFMPKPLTVRNSSEKALSVELQTLVPEKSASLLPPGYANLLGSATVKLSPAKFDLQPGEEKKISGTVFFPIGEHLKGKKFMCIVSAAVVGQSVKTQIYSRIYAHAE